MKETLHKIKNHFKAEGMAFLTRHEVKTQAAFRQMQATIQESNVVFRKMRGLRTMN